MDMEDLNISSLLDSYFVPEVERKFSCHLSQFIFLISTQVIQPQMTSTFTSGLQQQVRGRLQNIQRRE